jgi:hypothetical protein
MKNVVTICLCLLFAGCQGVKPYEGPGKFQTSSGGVGVAYNPSVQPIRQSKEFQSKVAQALGESLSPTLANFIRVYGVVSKASYIYPENHNPSEGIVRSNYYPGYSLFLQDDIILSPAMVEGKEGVVLYTMEGARIYQLPGTPEVVGDYLGYDFRITGGRKTFPVSVKVPRVINFTLRLGPQEDYQSTIDRLVNAFKVQRFSYRIYLRNSQKGFQFLSGEELPDDSAILLIRQEIIRRIEDILENSLKIGMDFKGGTVQLTGNENFDSDLRLKEVYKLPRIEEAIRACRQQIRDPQLLQAVNKLAEGLGYPE